MSAEAEERYAGQVNYMRVLSQLHAGLRPKQYLEIGIRLGQSLALATGPAIGVDPNPDVKATLSKETEVVKCTSDEFFEYRAENLAVDFCFIDGMHLFEFALRDFMNAERCATVGAVVVIDDIYPNHPAQAARRRRTNVWTGDVWRLVDTLSKFRPDLYVVLLDTWPTGLALIAGLDAANGVLQENYSSIIKDVETEIPPPPYILERQNALNPTSDKFTKIINELSDLRGSGADAKRIGETLRQL